MSEYRTLNARILGVDSSGRKPIAVQLREGQCIRAVGPVAESGLVEIVCDGRTYAVFHDDLIQRSTWYVTATERPHFDPPIRDKQQDTN